MMLLKTAEQLILGIVRPGMLWFNLKIKKIFINKKEKNMKKKFHLDDIFPEISENIFHFQKQQVLQEPVQNLPHLIYVVQVVQVFQVFQVVQVVQVVH